MALDVNQMVLRLNPLSGLGGAAGQNDSMERKRLQLMREQFENQKRQQAEENKLRLLAEQGQMARAQMQSERAQAKAEAAAAAKLQEQRLAAFTEFGKLNGEGKIEAGRAMTPLMSSLGMGVELQGEEGGLPRYRVDMDAQQAQKQEAARVAQASPYGPKESSVQSLNRLGALGLQGETGTLDPPLGIASSDEVDPVTGQSVGDRVMAAIGNTSGQPMRGPDEPDYTGGVPSNVIDMGAIRQQTLARLNPFLQGAVAAYPGGADGPLQKSAQQTANAVSALGLPAEKSAELFKSERTGPDSLIAAEMAANAQQDKFRETRDELTPIQAEQLKDRGVKRAADSYKNMGVKESIDSMAAADTIVELLTNDDNYDDGKVTNYLMALTHNKGAQTEGDAMRAIGEQQASSLQEAIGFFQKKIVGGFPTELRESILGFAEMVREQDRQKTYGWLDNNDRQANNPKTHELARDGYREFREANVPEWLRNEYEEDKQMRATAGGGDTGAAQSTSQAPLDAMSDFDLELEGQALEAGLDPEAMRPVIRHESGGKSSAVNGQSGATGIIQFLPSTAKALGTSVEELAKMSPAEQLPYAIQYFKGWGLDDSSTAADYAMATAAPQFIGKPPETVVYPKGSVAWEQNAPWRPSDGGDITVGSILKFYGLGAGAAAPETKPANAVDAEVLGILR